MAKQRPNTATVGVAENGNSAVLVTVAADGTLLDRRRIDLTRGLPTHPYHHEGSWAVGRYLDSPWARPTSLAEAIALVAEVQRAAAEGAREALAALAAAVSTPITALALRACAPLPATTEERIRDSRAASMADSILYREALAKAAEERGWVPFWYEREQVSREAEATLDGKNLDEVLRAMGRTIGPPWQAAHKLATSAALAARTANEANDAR